MEQPVATQNQEDLGLTIKWGVIGFVTFAGFGYGVYYLINKARSNSEESESLEDGNAATFAKQFNMALMNKGFNTGADMILVRNTALQIPTQDMFSKVERSYKKQFNTLLAKDMTDKLKPSQYDEIVAIKGGLPMKLKMTSEEKQKWLRVTKPYYWAKRFDSAFTLTWGPFSSTDKESLDILKDEIPSQGAFELVKQMYYGIYKRPLMDTLKKELSYFTFRSYSKALLSKPK